MDGTELIGNVLRFAFQLCYNGIPSARINSLEFIDAEQVVGVSGCKFIGSEFNV